MTELPGSWPAGRLSRRGFLIDAAATGILAACGSDDASTSATLQEIVDPPDAPGTYTLVQRFPQNVQEPGSIRLAMSLGTATGALVQDGPDTLGAQVTDIDGKPLGDRITAIRRDVPPGPYYDFRADMAEPGFFYLVEIPGPGRPLPPFDTPTFDDARGVEIVCTRSPDPCPFHDQTLTDALASGKGVVYLIGTPLFCSTGTCAPALESLIDLQPDYADRYVFVPAEVFTDDTATQPAPAVEAANLTYEPALFVTDATGTVVERLDAVWDATELAEVLDRHS